MDLAREIKRLQAAGATRIYGKILAPNDNSKNQIYLGGSLDVINIIPARDITADPENPRRLKGSLDFKWLTDDHQSPAPTAQLILYPDYPEVRLSGILRAARGAPNKIISSREPGRVLLLGVTQEGVILASALESEKISAKEFTSKQHSFPAHGVLRELPLLAEPGSDSDALTSLIGELARIHRKGWIRSWSLGTDGRIHACEAPQCGGYTLEAELGISRNSRAAPDYRGWEIKSHEVGSIEKIRLGTKPLTLMTPEPNGGLYRENFKSFWDLYSYLDRTGRPGRLGRKNFGGIYRCGSNAHGITGLHLKLDGVDPSKGTFTPGSTLSLFDPARKMVAASWSIASLAEKWSRKHSRVAFVPAEKKTTPELFYRYAQQVHLGQKTGIGLLLSALEAGVVYLDPAIKRTGGDYKKRSQFRVHARDLAKLYERFDIYSV